MPDNRITFLRNKTYNTKSNKIRKLRVPGGRLTVQYMNKKVKGPQTFYKTKSRLTGLKKLKTSDLRALSKTQRRICRPYGGMLTPSEVKDKILRAFLIEEVKVVKELVKKASSSKNDKTKKKSNKK